jgi:hypothetical protein
MKPAEKLKPNYGPVYCAMYPALAKICQKHGYALAVHGSLARDFDLIAVPWAEEISTKEEVLKEITTVFAINVVGTPEKRNHGRVAYTISVGWGECAMDFSFLMDFESVEKRVQSELAALEFKIREEYREEARQDGWDRDLRD